MPDTETPADQNGLIGARDEAGVSGLRRFRTRPWVTPAVQISLAIGISVAVAAVVTRYATGVERLDDWGYGGTFLIQLLNSATVFLPAPGHAYIFAVSPNLNPLLVGLTGGLGASLGEITSYVLGRGGHGVVSGRAVYQRLLRVTEKWGGPAVFVFAATPLPFDVAGIWAGASRYPLWRFLMWVTLGKVILVTTIAVSGHYGIPWLMDVFG